MPAVFWPRWKNEMIDLAESHLATIRSILREYAPDCEVRAFGSRVTGGARPYSDLDLAIIGGAPLGIERLGLLKEAFEESDLPIRVDVIDWRDTSESFRALVEPDCVTLIEATPRKRAVSAKDE